MATTRAEDPAVFSIALNNVFPEMDQLTHEVVIENRSSFRIILEEVEEEIREDDSGTSSVNV